MLLFFFGDLFGPQRTPTPKIATQFLCNGSIPVLYFVALIRGIEPDTKRHRRLRKGSDSHKNFDLDGQNFYL